MKLKLLMLISIFTNGIVMAQSQVEIDALIDFYNATDGPNWTNNTNWNTSEPVSTWFGVTVSSNQVTGLSMNNNNVNGTLPESFGDLTNLLSINMRNNGLTGNLPSSFGNLTNLSVLRFSGNAFTGQIPSGIGSFSNLRDLDFGNNDFSGTIPPELGNLSNLERFSFSGNNLTGSIPPELGNFSTSLWGFYLNDNNLSGELPLSLGNLTGLMDFRVNNNQLDGDLPNIFSGMLDLRFLYLGLNNFTGTIPDFSNNTDLANLDMNSNFFDGEIPIALTTLNDLSLVDLRNNRLTGVIPVEVTTMQALNSLLLENNFLSGEVPDFSNSPTISNVLIRDNNFQFGDLEPNHVANTQLSFYSYQSQNPFGEEETIQLQDGDNITLSANVTGSNNTIYFWYKDNASLVATSLPSYELLNVDQSDMGVYHCIVRNSIVTGLDLRRSSITLDITLNVDHIESNDFSIFPTAIKKEVHVNLKEVDGHSELQIFDLNGRKVKSFKSLAKENAIDLSFLDSGVYVFKISSNNKIGSRKIIKL
ncbi:leucine-rich repeat domain-containing protein [Winogradskyella sp.]|uniref:leucine-rich repeat domain-containing protein n=1 Tax=Winogradskyella sp. TaxID=1883156 RepID=UPI003BA8967E